MQPLNREQRRHPEKQHPSAGLWPSDRPQSSEHDLVAAKTPDVPSDRAKSSGHGKKTADKWNQ